MNKDFAKMHPVGKDPAILNPGVKTYVVTGAAETIDLSEVVEDVVVIQTTVDGTVDVTITGLQIGMTVIGEYGAEGSNDHVFDFGAVEIAPDGVTTATADSVGECFAVMVISATRGVVFGNNGDVVITTPPV